MGLVSYFTNWGRGVKGACSLVLVGIVLIIVGFGMLWQSERFKKHAATLESLPLLQAQEATGQSGLVKIQGVPVIENPLVDSRSGTQMLYYSYAKEEYSLQREEETKTTTDSDGKEKEETVVKYEKKWETVDSDARWADFKLGDIEIKNPGKAIKRWETVQVYNQTEDLAYDTTLSNEQLVGVAQRVRETVDGVMPARPLIIVGELSGGVIAGGDTFIISTFSDAQLLAAQKSAEKTQYWLYKFITWICLALGFTLLFSPLTALANILPGLGSMFSGLLFAIFSALSLLIVFLGSIVIRFWWAILIIVVLAAAYLVYDSKNKPAKQKAT